METNANTLTVQNSDFFFGATPRTSINRAADK